jgi:ABC-type glutathione transport system ATPase component
MSREMQMVFQDPYASLHPRMTVGRLISEPWAVHRGLVSAADAPMRVAELLDMVGLRPEHARRYPHQFSGGQRQRIGIARALALQPKVLICDEAVSALDVSVQAQILDLLERIRSELHVSYLFISHDLGVVRHLCDRVAVMYRGQIVEEGDAYAIYQSPAHEYTQRLLAAARATDVDDLAARARPANQPTDQEGTHQ